MSLSKGSPRARGALAAFAAVVAVSIAALSSWRAGAARPASPLAAEASAPALPAEVERATVVSTIGAVERSSRGAWEPVQPGDVLDVPDSVRTAAGASADIAMGGGARIAVAERSELTVREIDAAVQRLGLVRGRLAVQQAPDGTRRLRVESESGEIVASAPAGRWGVVAGPGTLAVAASDATVRVESAGAAVDVPPGQQATAWRGRPPLPPTPVPREVLLRVANALHARYDRLCAVVQGTVDPASEVLVDGIPVEVGADGTFVARVARSARRAAAVEVRHAAGRVERRTVDCKDDAGVSGFEVRWIAR